MGSPHTLVDLISEYKSRSADLAVRGETGEGRVDKLAAPERFSWVAPLSQRLTIAVMRVSGAASWGLTIWLQKRR